MVDWKIATNCIQATADNLVKPLGAIPTPVLDAPPYWDYLNETGLGWKDMGHSDFLEMPLHEVWTWYRKLLYPNHPSYPQGILPPERE